MLPVLGAAVVIVVFEAAAILLSTGMCVFKQSKLKRRDGKRFKGDVGCGNGYPGRAGRGTGTAGVIFASSGIGDGEYGYRGDGGDFGTDYGGGTDGGDDGGGDGGGCGGGGCGGGCGGGGGD